MAKKLYVNKTKIVQGVYDENMTKYDVIPEGTIEMDEKLMLKNLHAFEEAKKVKPAKDEEPPKDPKEDK